MSTPRIIRARHVGLHAIFVLAVVELVRLLYLIVSISSQHMIVSTSANDQHLEVAFPQLESSCSIIFPFIDILYCSPLDLTQAAPQLNLLTSLYKRSKATVFRCDRQRQPTYSPSPIKATTVTAMMLMSSVRLKAFNNGRGCALLGRDVDGSLLELLLLLLVLLADGASSVMLLLVVWMVVLFAKVAVTRGVVVLLVLLAAAAVCGPLGVLE